ncbi:MAG: transposase [Bacilli bacterium]
MKKKIEESKNKKIVDLILENNELKTGRDVSNVFNEMYGEIVQALLDKEMEQHLGYEKSSPEEKDGKNRRNGVTSKSKKVKTDHGEIKIKPPRDRVGTFEPQIVKKRQRVLEGLDDIVTSMYAKGLSLTDIQEMVKKLYSIELSTEKLSELTSAVNEQVKKWQNRELKKCYPFVYVDCLYCPVREELTSIKMAIYVILGIDITGQKEVLRNMDK